MPTDDDVKARAARKLELQELHKQLPPFDSEKHMEEVRANLRPLPRRHWQHKAWHRDFMYSGWRRLIAKKDQEIADLKERIFHCMGSCSDSVPTFAQIMEHERELAEKELEERDLADTGLYPEGTPGEEPEVHGLVDEKTEKRCGGCNEVIDPLKDKYYQDVPGQGDLCLGCHHTWVTETQ